MNKAGGEQYKQGSNQELAGLKYKHLKPYQRATKCYEKCKQIVVGGWAAMKPYEHWALVLNALVFVVALWVACIYQGQWKTMGETMVAAHGAWIVFQPKDPKVRITLDNMREMGVGVFNSGGGPALNVGCTAGIFPAPAIPDPRKILTGEPMGRAVVGPSVTFRFQPDANIPHTVDDKNKIWLVARCFYADQFGFDRETIGCMEYDPERQAFMWCERFNEAT